MTFIRQCLSQLSLALYSSDPLAVYTQVSNKDMKPDPQRTLPPPTVLAGAQPSPHFRTEPLHPNAMAVALEGTIDASISGVSHFLPIGRPR